MLLSVVFPAPVWYNGIREGGENPMSIFSVITSVLALLFSLYGIISAQIEKHKNLWIRIDGVFPKHCPTERNGRFVDTIMIRYTVFNKSQMPIAITRMQLIAGKEKEDAEPRQHLAEHSEYKQNDRTYAEVTVKSDVLPIRLDCLGATSGYLAFLIPPDILSGHETTVTFEICTNRGKAIQKTFVLHEDTRLR